MEQDACGRRAAAAGEIRFVEEREEQAGVLCRMRESGELPVRVTHNDTKLNNIMIDDDTRKAICVIDLDTVMPGLAAYDYGDSIRFGASTALEDETDLSKVTCDMDCSACIPEAFWRLRRTADSEGDGDASHGSLDDDLRVRNAFSGRLSGRRCLF